MKIVQPVNTIIIYRRKCPCRSRAFDQTAVVSSGVNLHIVASHEIGHALGLSHSEDQHSLMYPVYQGFVSDFRLSRDDIAGIQTIYG